MNKLKKPAWYITLPASVGFAAVAILVISLGVWGTRTQLAGAIVSSGVIEVQSNRQVVEHPDGGVVGEILARDGDRVQQGDVLVRLDDTILASEHTIVEGQLFEALVRTARLEAERDGSDAAQLAEQLQSLQQTEAIKEGLISGQLDLFAARAETQAQQIEQLIKQRIQIEAEIEGTQAQLFALKKQLVLIANELQYQKSLFDRGLTPASRVSALEREDAGLTGEIGRLEATIARLRGQIASTEIQIVELRAMRREEAISEIRELKAEIAELSERRIVLSEQLLRMDIRAPVAGTVHSSIVFANQSVIQAGEPMMYIVPQDAPLLVAAQVDAIHVDQVHKGQNATLRFPAFNQRETPELQGQVINISADVLRMKRPVFASIAQSLSPNPVKLND